MILEENYKCYKYITSSSSHTMVWLSIFKAILTRLLFAGHTVAAIQLIVGLKSDASYYLLGLASLVQVAELIFTMAWHKGGEWKWFCPSVIVFLLGSVPAIWMLELELLERRLATMKHVDGKIVDDVEKNLAHITQWILVVEQMLPLLLIVGRWLLPKGAITRNELSELLLVYFATAADIIEFFDGFNEVSVKYDRSLVFTILTLWSWSLIQFALVMTSTRDQRGTTFSQSETSTLSEGQRRIKRSFFKRFPRLAASRVVKPLPTSETNDGLRVIPIKPERDIREDTTPTFTCLDTSVWSIIASLLLQDAPFLVFRVTLILRYQVYSHTNIFFTCKNSLVIVLQAYRIFVLHVERREKLRLEKKAKDATAKKIAHLKKNGFLFVLDANLSTNEHDVDPYDAVSTNSSQ